MPPWWLVALFPVRRRIGQHWWLWRLFLPKSSRHTVKAVRRIVRRL